MNKKAVIYCRVSTKEQAEEGNSLITQEKLCREYALKNGYDIAEVFVEQGESAKTLQRTEWLRLLQFCTNKKNSVSAVIAYKIDRISRNTDDYSQIRILLKRYGVEIKSTSEFFENTPAGRFMENIIANVAQFDNDVRTERSVNGMKDAVREGRYVWTAPLGYKNGVVLGKTNIIQTEMADVVRKMYEMVGGNSIPVEEVRRAINKGLPKPISRTYFYRMLRNKLYTGWIVKFGEQHKGAFQPIVSEELFNQVQLALKYRTRRNFEYVRENPDFPLRRYISHTTGSKLTGYWAQGRSKKYPFYRFHFAGKGSKDIPKSKMETIFVNYLNRFALNEKYFKKLQRLLREKLIKAQENQNKEASRLQEGLNTLNEELRELSRNKAKGFISEQLFAQQVSSIEREMLQINADLLRLPKAVEYNPDELLKFGYTFLKNPGEIWKKASFSKQIKLQWLYFPKGVFFDFENCRTTETCFVFKLKELFSGGLSLGVPSGNETSEPLVHEAAFLKGVAEEIIRISKILNEKSEDNFRNNLSQ